MYAHETAARIEYPATSAEAYERGYSYGYGHRPAYHRHRHYHSVRPWSASEQSYSDAESTGRYSSASSEGRIRHTVYTAPHAVTYESHYREATPAETTRYSAPPQEYYRAEGRYYSGPSVTYHAKGGSAYADAPVETLIRHAIGEYDYKTPESEFQHRAGSSTETEAKAEAAAEECEEEKPAEEKPQAEPMPKPEEVEKPVPEVKRSAEEEQDSVSVHTVVQHHLPHHAFPHTVAPEHHGVPVVVDAPHTVYHPGGLHHVVEHPVYTVKPDMPQKLHEVKASKYHHAATHDRYFSPMDVGTHFTGQLVERKAHPLASPHRASRDAAATAGWMTQFEGHELGHHPTYMVH